MSQPRYFLLFVLLLPVAAASANAESAPDASQPAVAAPGATTIEGNRLEIYLDRTMHAIGDAEMVQGGQTIYGDRIDYDVLNQELHVKGNARVVQQGTEVTGPELRMQLEERRGEMKEPVFTMRNIPAAAKTAGASTSARGSAQRVTFDGPERETLYGARYTTCDAGVDDWYLRAGELELDHYAQTGTAQHASVEFKGVPILYTPWISFPFNSQRKSGFLAPSWGQTTRSGFEAALPYYWNIGPNMDATITPRYMSKRGTQLQTEFRYLTEDYSGEDNIEYLPNDDQSQTNRYYYKLAHRHQFGNGWSGRLNYERVSDNNYFSDMTTSIISTSRINLPQEGQINYNDSIWNFSAFVQQFQTLEDGFYQYERKPQLTLTGNKEWELARGSLY
ncbi:MAG: LPS-assembly protein LptD, partial [Methylobacterium sp.]|nr:LPS-assembly protein LptD [Methylobacterium sp.]